MVDCSDQLAVRACGHCERRYEPRGSIRGAQHATASFGPTTARPADRNLRCVRMIKRALCLALFGLLVPVALAETFTPCGNLLPDYDSYAEARGSTYVPMDSWIYPAMDRLHALGQVDIAYIGMKPWTRLSIVHMLQAGSSKMEETTADSDACRIYHSVQHELQPDIDSLQNPARLQTKLASVYTRF